jgi:uncharacterized membrane protein YjjB (DUF3815 family)
MGLSDSTLLRMMFGPTTVAMLPGVILLVPEAMATSVRNLNKSDKMKDLST